MGLVSVFHTLTYYVIFHRIVFLLLKLRVIDGEQYCAFVHDINTGFMGVHNGPSPVLEPNLRKHIRRAREEDWITHQVHLHALASLLKGIALAKKLDNSELENDHRRQSVQTLAALAVAVRTHGWTDSDESVAEVAEVFDMDPSDLKRQASKLLVEHLSDVSERLIRWENKTTKALVENEVKTDVDELRFARIDYGLALYDVSTIGNDLDGQITACSELVWNYETTNDKVAASKWGAKLVNLLSSKGDSRETVTALNSLGRELMKLNRNQEAASKLRQAVLLAEELEDADLVQTSQTFLDVANFMLK